MNWRSGLVRIIPTSQLMVVGDFNIAPYERWCGRISSFWKLCLIPQSKSRNWRRFERGLIGWMSGVILCRWVISFIRGGHTETATGKINRGRRLDHIWVTQSLQSALEIPWCSKPRRGIGFRPAIMFLLWSIDDWTFITRSWWNMTKDQRQRSGRHDPVILRRCRNGRSSSQWVGSSG